MIGIVILGILPAVYGFIYYFPDVWVFLTTSETKDIHMWQVKKRFLQSEEN